MPATAVLSLAFALSMGQVPYQSIGSYNSGAPEGAETGFQASATGGQYGHEQLYPFDAWDNWVHGQFQEIPSYGGHHLYRPYNYKHVLSQSQTAGGWGLSPTMPYSHEYFLRKQMNSNPALGYRAAAPQYPSPYGYYSQNGPSGPAMQPLPQSAPQYGLVEEAGGGVNPAVFQPAGPPAQGPVDPRRERIRRQAFGVPSSQGPVFPGQPGR